MFGSSVDNGTGEAANSSVDNGTGDQTHRLAKVSSGNAHGKQGRPAGQPGQASQASQASQRGQKAKQDSWTGDRPDSRTAGRTPGKSHRISPSH